MIGFYNYTVVLTYMSLLSAISGMNFASEGHLRLAVFCLALSGFLDMFDGKVARSKTDRTDNEKLFGIQLDSLCDIVAFGALPAFLCYSMGLRGAFGMLAIGFYCICGVIRLAYFNVITTNEFFSKKEHKKVYHGLPVTSIAVIFPVVFLASFFVKRRIFYLLLAAMMFATGALFIANFEMKKPDNKKLALLTALVFAVIIITFSLQKSSVGYRIFRR